jgi:hypothetical protein
MDCCQPEVIQSRFGDEYVQRKLERYRKKGPKETTSLLVKAISDRLEPGMTLLDIGGGIGDIAHALIQFGLAQATNIEASTAYLEACRQEATRLGHAKQINYVEDDFVEVAGKLDPADIVTLDRVICCYPFMYQLVNESLAKAKSLYGIVVPLDRWWLKAFISLYYNMRFFLQGISFRVFVHPIDEIEAHILASNFKRIFFTVESGWHVALYERVA